MDEKHMETVRNFREFADFLETHPEVEINDVCLYFPHYVETKEELAAWAKELAPVEKSVSTSDDSIFQIVKHFGRIRFIPFCNRNLVCRQVVVGTRVIEKPVFAPAVQTGTETVTEEIKEWRCDEPLLAPRKTPRELCAEAVESASELHVASTPV